MAYRIGLNHRQLVLIEFSLTVMLCLFTVGFALIVPSNVSFRVQPRIGTTELSMTSSAGKVGNSVILLDPNAVSSKVFSSDQRPVILFDGVCNMCNSAVNLALDWDPKGKLRFSALQSNVGRSLLEANGRKADDISSIVLVTKDGAFLKSDAVLKITEELTPLSLLPLRPAAILGQFIVPKFLRDLIYDGVADNRYQLMGKRTECRFDTDGEFEKRFINDDIALNSE